MNQTLGTSLSPVACLLGLFFVTSVIAEEDELPIDKAVVSTATNLHVQPQKDSELTGEIAAGTAVDVYERARLWARVTSKDDNKLTGWLHIMEIRLGAEPGEINSPGSGNGSANKVSNGLASFSRSVSSLFGGSSARNSDTGTIGIRGLAAADLSAAQPNPAALEIAESLHISTQQASAFALGGGLVVREIPYLELATRPAQ